MPGVSAFGRAVVVTKQNQVKRGEVHHLKAAMLLADLRGFSQLTDELPEEQIVELLNAFFDLVVPGVVAGGGDVLKYVGDAVITHPSRPSPDREIKIGVGKRLM